MPGFTTTRCRPAFTLAELLIALGVLATGMSMVAAVFPAALTETQRSVNDVVGENICDNALAIARVRLRHDPSNPPFGSESLEEGSGLGTDANYPIDTADADATRGFILLGRRMDSDADVNDYQLVVVAYQLGNPDDGSVRVQDRTADLANQGDHMTAKFVGDADNLAVGSPVILRGTGQFAWITALNGNVAVLDAADNALPLGDDKSVYILTEYVDPPDQDQAPYTAARSPAMYVLSTRTALRE